MMAKTLWHELQTGPGLCHTIHTDIVCMYCMYTFKVPF